MRGPGAFAQSLAARACERGEQRQVRRDIAVDRAEGLFEHHEPTAYLGGVDRGGGLTQHRFLIPVHQHLAAGAVARAQQVAQP